MANADAPRGFIPVRHLSGGDAAHTGRYNLVAANSEIFAGDLAVQTATGEVDRGAASPTAGTVVGVFAEYKAASDGGDVLVWDDPNTVFAAQTDNGTGTATAQTCINLNANVVATAGADGHSKMEIDESSAATTSTLPLKILRLYPVVGNAFGEFNVLEVILNTHVARGVGIAGV